MFKRLTEFLNLLMDKFGKSKLVAYISKALKVTGGWQAWIIKKLVEYGWKKAAPEIMSEAKHVDRKISDSQIRKKYEEQIKEKASEEKLIETELDILDPRRGR